MAVKRIMLSIVAVFLLSFITKAQDSSFSLKATVLKAGYSEVQLSKNSMGMFEIEVKVDNKNTLLLAVDNSDERTYFDKKSIEKLGYTLNKTDIRLNLGNKKLKVFTFDIKDLQIGDAHTGPMTLQVTDLSERNETMEQYGNKPLDGWLALDLLTRYSGILDIKNQKLYLRVK